MLQELVEGGAKKKGRKGSAPLSLGPERTSEADGARSAEVDDPKLSHWEECMQCSTWIELGTEASRACSCCGEEVSLQAFNLSCFNLILTCGQNQVTWQSRE